MAIIQTNTNTQSKNTLTFDLYLKNANEIKNNIFDTPHTTPLSHKYIYIYTKCT